MDSYLGPSTSDERKRKVTYFYNPSIGDYYYGENHPMKPIRIQMAHHLICKYGLHRRMEMLEPVCITDEDLLEFHSKEYVEFLLTINTDSLSRATCMFGLDVDCPAFAGVFAFSKASAGGSIGAAIKLHRGETDIAVNWAGGLHHAKKCMASGFCYVNDIVLGILELLKVYTRVLYVDIDVHHGDGVEEAFYTTNRVMTVSFHQFDGNFFPGSGNYDQTGVGAGKNYALNVPLKVGVDDDGFYSLFKCIMEKVMDVYKPEAVVLQSGADSLAEDHLGSFNLTTKGHARCLRFLRGYHTPLMVLGGGGFTPRNVARCWCYETAVAIGVELDETLPPNHFSRYFGPGQQLHIRPIKQFKNENTQEYMDKLKRVLLAQIDSLEHAPSVDFHTPPLPLDFPEKGEENMDQRPKSGIWGGEPAIDVDDDGNPVAH